MSEIKILFRMADGFQTMIGADDVKVGLKPTVLMKKELEKLTGENTVEILF